MAKIKKPYIICHMMTSVDGRIDCGMTAQLDGNSTYYATLDALDAPTRVSGRVTVATELTDGHFDSQGPALGKTSWKKNAAADSYNIVTDTKGTLCWSNDRGASQPHLILTSEQVGQDYLTYLDKQNISWIAAGKEHIDLAKAMEILNDQFGVERLAVVGGGRINGGFLKAGLIDEISIVIGPGIDGRTGQPALFDGREDSRPAALELKSVKSFDDGAVHLTYLVK